MPTSFNLCISFFSVERVKPYISRKPIRILTQQFTNQIVSIHEIIRYGSFGGNYRYINAIIIHRPNQTFHAYLWNTEIVPISHMTMYIYYFKIIKRLVFTEICNNITRINHLTLK